MKRKTTTRSLKQLIFFMGLLVLSLIIGQRYIFSFTQNVEAAGDLAINWGVPTGDPIFVVENFLPGEEETRSVIVTNNASIPRTVGVKAQKTEGTENFETVLDLTILVDSTQIYGGTSSTGPKTLADLFTESSGIAGLPLSDVGTGDTVTYMFKVKFAEGAGNEFQNARIVFDLSIGLTVVIPAECQNLPFDGELIFGTQKNDDLNGTSRGDLIFSLEGNDKVFGGSGRDCIIGGKGKDKLDGGSNDDIVYGNEGRDEVDGGSGNDILFGGEDKDKLSGGSGNDKLNGDEGNDKLSGGSENDTLNGDGGNDSANGNSGIDSCNAEDENSCEF